MISFLDLVAALRQRLRLAVVIGALVTGTIILLALVQPRMYSAGSSLLVDLAHVDPTDDNAQTSIPILESVIGTQTDILRSDAVLGDAARKLGLISRNDNGPDQQVAIAKLRKNLAIANGKDSNVIRLAFTADDANTAANTVNAIVDVFLTKQIELRNQPAANSAEWYEARIKEVRGRLEEAQKHLSDFQRAHDIVGVDRMDLEGDKVRSLSTQLVEAQAAVAAARSKASVGNTPDVANANIVQDLEREVGLQRGKVAEMARTLGPNHPQMKAAQAQLDALRGSLADARSTQAASVQAESMAAMRREADLRAQLQRQQGKMIGMSTSQDQLMVLQRDVDAARETYDQIRKSFNEAKLKSEISQANTSRLDRAEPPILPSKPSLTIWFAAALILGIVASVGTIALLEILQPRIRTVASTERLTDMDVIVDMTPEEKAFGLFGGLSGRRKELSA